MSSGNFRRSVAAMAAFFFLAADAAVGQAVYGNIVGTVMDASGAGVPGAKVTITDTGRSVAFTAVTNDSGNFVQRLLIAGVYRVRVEKPGFQAWVQDNLVVTVDADTRIESRLQVGEITETVEVSGEAPLPPTASAR